MGMSKRLINRRQFLTRTGSALALGAVNGVLSPSVARAAARGRPGGHVHFTREHTETNSMDGAIKSGIRVA